MKGNITPRFIGDNVLTELMKKSIQKCKEYHNWESQLYLVWYASEERKFLHKEYQKEKAQGQDLSHTQPSTNEDNSTSQYTAQMNPYGNNHSASSFPPKNMHTNTPINEESFIFMDPMMDNLYRKRNEELFCSICTLLESDK